MRDALRTAGGGERKQRHLMVCRSANIALNIGPLGLAPEINRRLCGCICEDGRIAAVGIICYAMAGLPESSIQAYASKLFL